MKKTIIVALIIIFPFSIYAKINDLKMHEVGNLRESKFVEIKEHITQNRDQVINLAPVSETEINNLSFVAKSKLKLIYIKDLVVSFIKDNRTRIECMAIVFFLLIFMKMHEKNKTIHKKNARISEQRKNLETHMHNRSLLISLLLELNKKEESLLISDIRPIIIDLIKNKNLDSQMSKLSGIHKAILIIGESVKWHKKQFLANNFFKKEGDVIKINEETLGEFDPLKSDSARLFYSLTPDS